MDIPSYIASGILEAYVLGEVSPEEAREVACLTEIYPELKAELEALQQGMEGFARQFDQAPPAALKGRIMTALDEEAKSTEARIPPVSSNTPLISEEEEKRKAGIPLYLQIAAAVGVLLLGIWLGNQLNSPELETLNQQVAELSTQQESLEKKLSSQSQELALLADPANQLIELAPQPIAGNATVRVLWQPDAKSTFLVNSTLPDLKDDQDYQLWALVDGTPVDLGVLPRRGEGLTQMASIENPDAFAITLEPKGGSKVPTLTQLMVIGEV
ncbi:MAG: anti-sigma factor [Bacteroidota bacterium]